MKKLTTVLFALLLTTNFIAAQTATSISVGEEIQGSLQTGSANSYTIELNTESYMYGEVNQKTVDVVVTIYNPDGEKAATFDSPARGRELFQLNTKAAGTYRIEVTPFEDEEGEYSIMVSKVEPIAKDPAGKVAQMMTPYSGEEVPGAAAMVIKVGEVVFQESYGMANLAYDIPMSDKTVHNIGSTSKQFLTFGALLLEEQGKLNLDDDVRKYIPELPEFEHTVTLRHLVNHTSGYREFLNLLVMTGRNPGTGLSQEKLIEIVQRQPKLQNEPGTEWNYNNTGYGLMTEVIARVTETPFPQWMKENVFGPIGMNNTQVRLNQDQVVEHRSQGYQNAESGGYEEVTDLGGAMGAGGIHTTLGDLDKWIQNLLQPKVGTKAMIEEMTTPFELKDESSTGYGLGFFVSEFNGLDYFHHGGADVAHRSMLMVFPEIRGAVVTQSNYAGFNGSIANQIAEAFFKEQMEKAEEAEEEMAEEEEEDTGKFEYDPADFDPLTGRYELQVMPGFILTFSRDDDRLYTQATGQPEVDITATSDSTFSLVGVNASVTFHLNEDGSADSLTLHQNGHHVAKKVEFELKVEQMEEYVGRYFSEEIETVYDVVLKDSSLLLQNYLLEDDITLSAGKLDEFSGGFPISTVVFTRNSAGEVDGFKAGNGRTRDVFFQRWE